MSRRTGGPVTAGDPASEDAPARPTGRWWPYLLLGLVLVVVLRAFVVQSFSVPSESMEPGIQPGDRLLANRLVRGDDVHRGDIVVFDGTTAFPVSGQDPAPPGLLTSVGRSLAGALTLDTGTDYVKRVIGLPGDRVSCCDGSGRVQVNGVGLDEPYLPPGERPSALTFDVVVPAGHLWVLGDHRSESGDSRAYLGRPGGGMVPVGAVIGQATVRYWPPGRLGSLGGPGPAASVPSSAGASQ